MNAAQFSADHGGHMDRGRFGGEQLGKEEAARFLGSAEATPSLAKRRDLRLWAVTATVIGVLMGACIALAPLSDWFTIGYCVVLVSFVLVQRRYATVAPKGVTALYNSAVAVATVFVVVSIFGLGAIFGGYDNSPFWASFLGGVLVASPMLTVAAVIQRRAV
ncbi:hypothetical protein [Dietzia sp.]|uniref:hypothetical protein n=1 Tax=Dietzia sp. TaxID=1871616 RepID=UPI002FD8FA84